MTDREILEKLIKSNYLPDCRDTMVNWGITQLKAYYQEKIKKVLPKKGINGTVNETIDAILKEIDKEMR